jgi:hypothetical protein
MGNKIMKKITYIFIFAITIILWSFLLSCIPAHAQTGQLTKKQMEVKWGSRAVPSKEDVIKTLNKLYPIGTQTTIAPSDTVNFIVSSSGLAKRITYANFLTSATVATNTITSNGSGGGNWNAGTTWAGGIVPTTGTDVIIADGDVVAVTVSASCNSITIIADASGFDFTQFNINSSVSLIVKANVTFSLLNNGSAGFDIGGTTTATAGRLILGGRFQNYNNGTGIVTFTGNSIVNEHATTFELRAFPKDILRVANGGTNSSLTATSGTLLRGTGSAWNPSAWTTPASFAQGDLLFATSTNSVIALAKNSSATRYLSNTGTTNNPAWAQINLANGVTGILPVANGGTGSATLNTWLITGNASTVDGTNYLGTSDNIPLSFRVNNEKAGRIDKTLLNDFYGYLAGGSNTTGNQNTALGTQALFTNTTSNDITAVGFQALYNSTSGVFSTAVGNYAGFTTTTGGANTFMGYQTAYNNTTGNNNVAIGYEASQANTVGGNNTAIGYTALFSNKAGSYGTAVGNGAMFYANNTATPFTEYNTAVGFEALRGSTTASNNTGSQNTAVGYSSLRGNTTGNTNSAIGYNALLANTTGYNNSALSGYCLTNNTTGYSNIGAGIFNLYYNTTGALNVAMGELGMEFNTTGTYNSSYGSWNMYNNTTGNFNTSIGFASLFTNTTGSDNVAIGKYSGFYETGSSKLFIDNTTRVSEQDGRNSSLVYGKFDATVADQVLVINGTIYMRNSVTNTNYFTLKLVSGVLTATDTGSANAP